MKNRNVTSEYSRPIEWECWCHLYKLAWVHIAEKFSSRLDQFVEGLFNLYFKISDSEPKSL